MPAVKAYFRALPYQEVAAALETVDGSKASKAAKLCLRFLVLTAARSGEVRSATWAEVDFEAREWRIPGERMKGGREHRVPLSDAALAVLERVRGVDDLSGLIFPSPLRPGRPLSPMTLTKILRDRGRADRATVHGFRSTFRDWCAETGKPRANRGGGLGAHRGRCRGGLLSERPARAAPGAREPVGGVPDRGRGQGSEVPCVTWTPSPLDTEGPDGAQRRLPVLSCDQQELVTRASADQHVGTRAPGSAHRANKPVEFRTAGRTLGANLAKIQPIGLTTIRVPCEGFAHARDSRFSTRRHCCRTLLQCLWNGGQDALGQRSPVGLGACHRARDGLRSFRCARTYNSERGPKQLSLGCGQSAQQQVFADAYSFQDLYRQWTSYETAIYHDPAELVVLRSDSLTLCEKHDISCPGTNETTDGLWRTLLLNLIAASRRGDLKKARGLLAAIKSQPMEVEPRGVGQRIGL